MGKVQINDTEERMLSELAGGAAAHAPVHHSQSQRLPKTLHSAKLVYSPSVEETEHKPLAALPV